MPDLSATMTVLSPYPGIFAYYDGRIAGKRLHSPAKNWLDDGAYKLGIATYSLVEGHDAIVYDTHMSLDHARAIRVHLEKLGVTKIRVVLSHWHTDHIAGNEVFADCEIIANRLTAEALHANRQKLEAGDPPIKPVVMPTHTFVDRLVLTLGQRSIELLQFDIHSADGTVLFLRDEGLLFAGDTVEDTITYISEPEYIATHIRELDRLAGLPIEKILPDHGSREMIAAGGYPKSLIAANRDYLTRLLADIDDPTLDRQSLEQFAADDIASGRIGYFAPYEDVHRANIAALREVSAG
ncbi:MAG: MBL fold metallo-hydrolase [Allorhizobium sp.]